MLPAPSARRMAVLMETPVHTVSAYRKGTVFKTVEVLLQLEDKMLLFGV